jgi:hypothetical protein
METPQAQSKFEMLSEHVRKKVLSERDGNVTPITYRNPWVPSLSERRSSLKEMETKYINGPISPVPVPYNP